MPVRILRTTSSMAPQGVVSPIPMSSTALTVSTTVIVTVTIDRGFDDCDRRPRRTEVGVAVVVRMSLMMIGPVTMMMTVVVVTTATMMMRMVMVIVVVVVLAAVQVVWVCGVCRHCSDCPLTTKT